MKATLLPRRSLQTSRRKSTARPLYEWQGVGKVHGCQQNGSPFPEKRIYLSDRQALAYFREEATPDFWDVHWVVENLRRVILSCKTDKIFMPRIRKYLPRGSKVLEGGCGRGQLLNALRHQGYHGVGIDFASKTIERIKEAVPELDVLLGDVRNLPIENETLDGYISAGVIEHFWDGYDAILSEMSRTIRSSGFLFLSFPYMSLLRRLKARIGLYPCCHADDVDTLRYNFYQYALPWQKVITDLGLHGFVLCEAHPCDGIKGLKDEIRYLRKKLQSLYDGEGLRFTRYVLDRTFRVFAGHSILLVMQKAPKT